MSEKPLTEKQYQGTKRLIRELDATDCPFALMAKYPTVDKEWRCPKSGHPLEVAVQVDHGQECVLCTYCGQHVSPDGRRYSEHEVRRAESKDNPDGE